MKAASDVIINKIIQKFKSLIDGKSCMKPKYRVESEDGNDRYHKLFTITPAIVGYGDLFYSFEVIDRSSNCTIIEVYCNTNRDEKYLNETTVKCQGTLGDQIKAYRFKDTTNKVERLEIWGKTTAWNIWDIFPKTYKSTEVIGLEWNGVGGTAFPTNANTNVPVESKIVTQNALNREYCTKQSNGTFKSKSNAPLFFVVTIFHRINDDVGTYKTVTVDWNICSNGQSVDVEGNEFVITYSKNSSGIATFSLIGENADMQSIARVDGYY